MPQALHRALSPRYHEPTTHSANVVGHLAVFLAPTGIRGEGWPASARCGAEDDAWELVGAVPGERLDVPIELLGQRAPLAVGEAPHHHRDGTRAAAVSAISM